jgi:hypothetical protein
MLEKQGEVILSCHEETASAHLRRTCTGLNQAKEMKYLH